MCKTVKMNRSNMNIDDPSEEIYGYNRTFDLWEQSEHRVGFLGYDAPVKRYVTICLYILMVVKSKRRPRLCQIYI